MCDLHFSMFKLRTFGWQKEPKTSSQGEELRIRICGGMLLFFSFFSFFSFYSFFLSSLLSAFFSYSLSYFLLWSDLEEMKEEKSETKS